MQLCLFPTKFQPTSLFTGIYAIWLKRGREQFTAAVDGSVYLKHATVARVMRETLEELACHVTLGTATDGSGLGSALIASIA